MPDKRKEEKTLLYYPTIEIKDGFWLRNAILYWDKIASIVPESDYDDINSIEIEYLRQADLYEPIHPREIQSDFRLYEIFFEEVKENIREKVKPEGFYASYSISGRAKYDIRQRNLKQDVGQNDMDNFLMHIEKMPYKILDYLLEEEIVKKGESGTWVNVNVRFAQVYMATLAKYLAKVHRNTEIGTDIRDKFYYPYAKKMPQGEKQYYLNIVLNRILPVPNMHISIPDILDFKIAHKRELYHFRKRIEEIQWQLKSCSTTEEVEERALFFQKEIEDEVRDVEELMHRRFGHVLRQSMRNLIPIGLGAGIDLAALSSGLSSTKALVAGTAVSIGAAIYSAYTPIVSNEPRLDEKNAYLLSARNEGIIQPRTREER